MVGGHDVVGHPDEDVANLNPGHLLGEDKVLQELHALGSSAHENSVKEDVLDRFNVLFGALEFRLELRVEAVELFLILEEAEATSDAESLHWDLLLVNINTLDKFFNSLLDQLLELGLDLLFWNLLIL